MSPTFPPVPPTPSIFPTPVVDDTSTIEALKQAPYIEPPAPAQPTVVDIPSLPNNTVPRYPVVGVWHYDGADRNWHLSGNIIGYDQVSVEEHAFDQGTWTLMATDDTPNINKIDGTALVTFDYDGQRWATGRTTQPEVEADVNGNVVVTFAGETGLTLLQDVTCWPNPNAVPAPGNLAVNQPAQSKQYTGPAETVINDLIDDYFRGQHGAKVTIPASQGRGGNVHYRARMDNLLTLVEKAAKASGSADDPDLGRIVVDINLRNTSGTRADLTVSFHETVDRSGSAILSHRFGSLSSWKYAQTRPTATRAIVGGAGDGVTRVWAVVTTPRSEAAAAAWGGHVDTFVDAADTWDLPKLVTAGEDALKAALVEDTFTLDASNSAGMKVWRPEKARLGDKIKVELANRVSTIEVFTGRRLDVGSDDTAVTVTPLVGDPDGASNDNRLARLVRQARRDIRRVELSRDTTAPLDPSETYPT